MKTMMVLAAAMVISSGAMAVEKTTTMTTTPTTPAVTNTVAMDSTLPNTLGFNFVALAQGKTNVYFDVGGLSSRVSPSLSYRGYSSKEERKDIGKATVDRSLATLGASIVAIKGEGKSLVINPYLYFGTEKDARNTDTKNGIGARLMGQVALNKAAFIQVGVDGNNMEDTFKSEVYVGAAFAL